MTSIVRTALYTDHLNIRIPKILDQPDTLFVCFSNGPSHLAWQSMKKILISDIWTSFSDDWSGFWTTLWHQMIRNRTALEPFKYLTRPLFRRSMLNQKKIYMKLNSHFEYSKTQAYLWVCQFLQEYLTNIQSRVGIWKPYIMHTSEYIDFWFAIQVVTRIIFTF